MAKRGRKPKNQRAVYLPYEGFTVRDQMVALEECKQAQMARQEGLCVCGRYMDDEYVGWISGRGGISLRKWAQGHAGAYDPVTRKCVFRKRSPAEIKAEYETGDYFLYHHGCLLKAIHMRHIAPEIPVQRLYEATLRTLGVQSSDELDPSTALSVFRQCQDTVLRRGKERMAEVARLGREVLMKNNPEWGTGKWREFKGKRKGPKSRSEPVTVGGGLTAAAP